MTRAALVRGIALALGCAVLVAGAVLAVYDLRGAIVTLAILAPLGIATVAATRALLAHRERLGSLRRQALITGALAFGPLALTLVLFVQLMFVSAHDALLTFAMGTYGAVLGLWATRLLSNRVMDDVDALRAGLMAVGAGERELDLKLGGDDELAQVGREVEAMVVRLAAAESHREDADAARRSLIAAVSHDLRTPVTALRLLADAVDDEIGDPETRRVYIRRLGVHVRALGALIDDLFELTRIEAGEVTWTMQQVDIDELVEETVAAMAPAAIAGGISVRAEIAPALVPARGQPRAHPARAVQPHPERDPPHAGRRQRHGARGERRIDAWRSRSPTPARASRADDRERVFEAFVQGGDRSSRTDGSAGLGLAISRAIVEAHGGRIWVVDEPGDGGGAGARVRFSLPGSSPAPLAA